MAERAENDVGKELAARCESRKSRHLASYQNKGRGRSEQNRKGSDSPLPSRDKRQRGNSGKITSKDLTTGRNT